MDTEPTLLYLATILPPILLLIIIWKADRFKEPGHLLAASFLLGAAIGLPLHLLIGIVEDILAPLLGLDLQNLKDADYKLEYNLWDSQKDVYPWLEAAYMNFLRAAYLEESIKFALIIFFCVQLTNLDEPMDAIVYAAAIGLGYAAMENIGYLYYELGKCATEDCWTWKMVKVRYYPLVMHFGFGVVMGLFLSHALFGERDVFKNRVMTILSLLVPVMYHGVYNYNRTFDTFPLLTIIFIIGIYYYLRKEQDRRITEPQDKVAIDRTDIFYSYMATLVLVVIIIGSILLIH